MAFRTLDHSDMSLFKNRLWKLMESKQILTAKELAKRLLSKGYVTVNQSYSFDDISIVENRAIGSIEKKIQKHLNSDDTRTLQGEFVSAYCKFFNCSADYLFGYIDLPTHADTDIQKKTGLSEHAIQKLCFYNSGPPFHRCINTLNLMFNSQNFENALYHIPDYIEKVKIDEILRRKRRERQLEVATLYADQDPHEAYNWPFADDLEKNFKENEDSMYLQEYIVNKNFRYVIQELERISREEQSGSKS